jgi:hypothetical protein
MLMFYLMLMHNLLLKLSHQGNTNMDERLKMSNMRQAGQGAERSGAPAPPASEASDGAGSAAGRCTEGAEAVSEANGRSADSWRTNRGGEGSKRRAERFSNLSRPVK